MNGCVGTARRGFISKEQRDVGRRLQRRVELQRLQDRQFPMRGNMSVRAHLEESITRLARLLLGRGIATHLIRGGKGQYAGVGVEREEEQEGREKRGNPWHTWILRPAQGGRQRAVMVTAIRSRGLMAPEPPDPGIRRDFI